MNPATVKVWDPLIRVFHWSLVGAFAVCYFTQEENYDLHLWCGYAILGLILFRTLWGFIGPRYARFRQFVYSPRRVAAYLRGVLNRTAERFIGHNPAGGAMILLLLLGNLVITVSGVALDAAENRAGPLAGFRLFTMLDTIKLIHNVSTYATVALVALHVLGTIVESRLHRENLILAMITGRKRGETGANA
jgi:cytochrome b